MLEANRRPIGAVGRLPILSGRILRSATQEVTIVDAAAGAGFVLPVFYRTVGGYGRDVWEAGVTGFTGYDHHEGDRHDHCNGRV